MTIEFIPQKKKKKWILPLVILGAVVIAVLLFFATFHITRVEVVGNTQYADEDVERLTLDGFLHHNSIYLAKIKKTVQMDDIPFIERVEVEYVNSSTVRLHVIENLAIGRIEQQGAYYYFDVSGVILNVEVIEPASEEIVLGPDALEAENVRKDERDQSGQDTDFHPALTDYVPTITGLTDAAVSQGEKISVADEGVFQTILSLTKLLDRFGMEPDQVAFDEAGWMTLHFGSARIALGDDSHLEEKMSRASAILPQLTGEGLAGVLHLENYTGGEQNIVFTQDQA